MASVRLSVARDGGAERDQGATDRGADTARPVIVAKRPMESVLVVVRTALAPASSFGGGFVLQRADAMLDVGHGLDR